MHKLYKHEAKATSKSFEHQFEELSLREESHQKRQITLENWIQFYSFQMESLLKTHDIFFTLYKKWII